MAGLGRVDLKMCLLGKSAAGKTCLAERFSKDHFTDGQVSTVGAAFTHKVCKSSSGSKINVGIWDTAGSERYESMGRHYYKDAHGCLICFDLTDYRSWEKVDFWLRELRKSRAQEDVAIAVVGCKLDLIQKNPARRAVSQAEAESYCSRIDAKYFETSALTGENCNAPFEYLVDEFVLMRASRPELQKSHRDRIEVSAPSSSQSKCC